MQNLRESKQSADGDVCAVRFNNNPRALFRRVLPAVFSLYFMPIFFSLHTRMYMERIKSCAIISDFFGNLKPIYHVPIYYMPNILACY